MTEVQEKRPQSVVFGPVPSRRLGMSLGIDVIPMKICSYDCIYCELGKTTQRTIERKPYMPADAVVEAMEHYFAENREVQLDYVTFSGSGEPTLNSDIGWFIRKAKELTSTPIAVLTNGSLLYAPQVRRDLLQADLVVPSLDAVWRDAFVKVNQPARGLEVERVVSGIEQFSREFSGEVWLEILLVDKVNAHLDHVRALGEAAGRIAPTKTQLTTVVRPPGAGRAAPVSAERLREMASYFDGYVEVVAEVERRQNPAYQEKKGDEIVAMLKIRPMTVRDISSSTGMHGNEVLKYLDQLRRDHAVQQSEFEGKDYFTISR
jgi:wyosine [tRNA(Phe)-imidazoG37] synthetase (radical SAM superfamily)